MNEMATVRRIVEKAVKNGWHPKGIMTSSLCSNEIVMLKLNYNWPFNHDFAEAFWGKKDVCKTCGEDKRKGGFWHLPNWAYHLQQMVLEEDPTKYLERFL